MRGKVGVGRCRTRGLAAQRSDFAPTPTLPRGRGRGATGVEVTGQALLLPPHAGEGRDGGGVGREDSRRSGRTLPPPQPSTADGGRGATGVEAAGQPCSFPRMRGKAGMGGRVRREDPQRSNSTLPPLRSTSRQHPPCDVRGDPHAARAMHLVQLFLPLRDNDGAAFPRTLFDAVRAELLEVFGGVTAVVRSPGLGAWEDDGGAVQRDEVVLLEVMAMHLDHGWWAHYRWQLEQRFDQDEVLVRAMQVERL